MSDGLSDLGWCMFEDGVHPFTEACRDFRVVRYDYCYLCDTDTHRCPGCGASVNHGEIACEECGKQ